MKKWFLSASILMCYSHLYTFESIKNSLIIKQQKQVLMRSFLEGMQESLQKKTKDNSTLLGRPASKIIAEQIKATTALYEEFLNLTINRSALLLLSQDRQEHSDDEMKTITYFTNTQEQYLSQVELMLKEKFKEIKK